MGKRFINPARLVGKPLVGLIIDGNDSTNPGEILSSVRELIANIRHDPGKFNELHESFTIPIIVGKLRDYQKRINDSPEKRALGEDIDSLDKAWQECHQDSLFDL